MMSPENTRKLLKLLDKHPKEKEVFENIVKEKDQEIERLKNACAARNLCFMQTFALFTRHAI